MEILSSFDDIWQHGLILEFMYGQLKYYTTWNIIFLMLFQYTQKYIDLHLSCLIVAFAAFSITYIHPKEYISKLNHCYSIKFRSSFLEYYGMDFCLHWLPLILVYMYLPVEPIGAKTCWTFFGILIFLVTVNAKNVYNMNIAISFGFAIFAVVLRCILF